MKIHTFLVRHGTSVVYDFIYTLYFVRFGTIVSSVT